MTSKCERLVQLGFSEPIADASHRKVIAHHSPNWLDWDGGKIGGIPSWLNPRDLPTQAPFRCPACVRRNNNKETTTTEEEKKEGTIMRFITQIYSPADKDTTNQNAFHRSLYVFACPHPKCSIQSGIVNEQNHDSILVLRGQVARDNEFYPMDCNEEEDNNDGGNDDEDGVLWEETWDKNKSTTWDVQTCAICNQRATGYCPKLQKWFCSKDHQRDYNNIIVKKKMMGVSKSIIRYAESELVVEEEPVDYDGNDDDDDGTDNVDNGGKGQEELAQKLNETSLFAGEEKDGNGDDDDGVNDELLEQSDLNDMTGVNNTVGGTSDPITMEFYSRIGVADGDVKSQCLRYCRWPKEEEETEEDRNCGPLWISSQCRPRIGKNDIPPCEYCGAERKFEFQIMPQMVNFLLTKDWSEETNEDDDDGESDAKKALLVASDIVQKADESGTGETLPEAFREKQEELVKKFKDKILTKDENGKDIDWGTIAVYTCTASCGGGNNVNDETFGAYRKEFGWRQPTLDTLDS